MVLRFERRVLRCADSKPVTQNSKLLCRYDKAMGKEVTGGGYFLGGITNLAIKKRYEGVKLRNVLAPEITQSRP